MTAIVPLDPVRRLELQRLTEDNGFGLPQGEADGWSRFIGLAIPSPLHVARATDGWLVSIGHAGVMEAVTADHPTGARPGIDGEPALFVDELGPMLRRMARFSRSLPTAPLDSFTSRTAKLPRTTEAERLVVQRVGQQVFRTALIDYWNGRCPMTGITDRALLRASHIVPWIKCDDDAQRLDVHNGLLLAAHWDAAFDAGLVSFDVDGHAMASPQLSAEAHQLLGLDGTMIIASLTERHQANLARHRATVFQEA